MGAVTMTVDIVVGVVLSVVASVTGTAVVLVVVVEALGGIFEKVLSIVSLTLKLRIPVDAVDRMESVRLR